MTSVVNEKDFATAFLEKVGAPYSDDMAKAVASWLRQESGSRIVRNNPFNLTFFEGMPGYVGMVGGFAEFDSLSNGIAGTIKGLTDFPATDWRGYAQIVEAAKAGDPARFMQCLAQSAWDAARYGTLTGGPNHIVNVYDTFGGFRDVSVEPGPLGAEFPEEPIPAPEPGPEPTPEPTPQPTPTPAPEPTPTPAPEPTPHTYTVEAGDTLWAIAEKELGNGTLWPEIWDANKDKISNPSVIYAGQVLTLPDGITVATSPNQYTVKSGDSLSAIAEHFYSDANRWPDIYRANRTLIGGNPNLIHPGQVLTIPGV